MHDNYEIPALVLTACLLPGFGYLHMRFRGERTRLWFLGFLLAIVRMVQHYNLGWWDFSDEFAFPWIATAGHIAIQVGSVLFLSSLSTKFFKVGRFKVRFAVPYTLPLIAYCILYVGVYRQQPPHGFVSVVFPLLWLMSFAASVFWAALPDDASPMPRPVSLFFVAVMAGVSIWVYFTQGPGWLLSYAECCSHFMTVILLIFAYRRLSPGVGLSILGFSSWSLIIFWAFPSINHHSFLQGNLTRFIVMGKVVAALGLILLTLEEELELNKAAGERERQARRELEAYTNLILSRRRVEDFDNQGPEICQTIVSNSRFSQAALFLMQTSGTYELAGVAGFNNATAIALNALAARIPVAGFLAPGTAESAVDNSLTVRLNLDSWLSPGDDLKHLGFTSAYAVPMRGRSATEGVLLLSGMRNRTKHDPLRVDDLLPVEMLTTRLQAVRSQTTMLEKLIDSEKFAGLGQLAGNVTQQLNNPLTVILGYASLLEDAPQLNTHDRRAVDAILSEARHMRSTIESLTRVARTPSVQTAAVSVSELLADMEHLHRSEFLQRSIEFRLTIEPSLPRALCHAQQLRQAVLHCLQFAMEAVQHVEPGGERTVRLEAKAQGNRVRILVAHTGRGFLDAERAFDPFVPPQAVGGETAGLGLSLCSTILKDNNGNVSAVNLNPCGAAITLELRAA
jgi:signal transduction histidine kinase